MEDDRTPSSDSKSRLPLLVSLSFIAALLLLHFFSTSFRHEVDRAFTILTSNDEQRIERWVDRLGIWGPLLIVLGMILQMFLIVAPSVALMVVSVLAYGPLPGAFLAVASVVAASTVAYSVGAWLGPKTVYRMIGRETEETVETYLEKYGFWTVVIVRLSPALSNDAISFAAGLVRMGYGRFIAATALGTAPLAVVIASFGRNWDRMEGPLIWISAASLAAWLGYVVYDRRRVATAE